MTTVSQGSGGGYGVFFEKGLCNFPSCDEFLVAQSIRKFLFLGWSEGSNRLVVTNPVVIRDGKSPPYGEGGP